MTKKKINRVGSSFESFLVEDGIHEEVNALAVKRVLAWQIEQEMEAQGLTKAKMAARMRTSRSQLDRLLDPSNDKVQLDTIHRAAKAIGKKLMIGLENLPKATA
jgi:predicted XRE-type DNA-binding protein